MSIELKIKSKHLSEEARIIRFEEKKLLKQLRYNIEKHKESGMNSEFRVHSDPSYQKYESISSHRKRDVRNENRATFLARAFLAGVPYEKVENKRKDDYTFCYYILPRLKSMVAKYGSSLDRTWSSKSGKYILTPEKEKELLLWCKL